MPMVSLLASESCGPSARMRGVGFDVGDQVNGINLAHAQGGHVHARVLRRKCKRCGIVLSRDMTFSN